MNLPRSLLCLWIQVMGLSWFLLGFFPLKSPLEGSAPNISEEEQMVDTGDKMFSNLSMAWKRRVGQVVIEVVDALRADFVFGEKLLEQWGINYEHSFMVRRKEDEKRLLARENASSTFSILRLLASASSPTVTLPRIKAIATGSIPGYIDIILNFGSKALLEDSLIQQWRQLSREIIFFGDDTWIKLFPGRFLRAEGTSSFFVSDFTEVDNNVTRNLPAELASSDWDVMILHYLGLDHIGHVFGPSSPLIPSKLEEMEGIIEKCVESLEKKEWKDGLPPLILVLGDHGMADMGGHGGSTLPETLTPILALSPVLQNSSRSYKIIHQTDLAPTLAWLTGVPIPRNSMGSLIGPLVTAMESNSEYKRNSALYNLKQVLRIVSKNSLVDGSMVRPLDNNGSMDEILAYVEFLGSVLFDNVLEYNYGYMFLGTLTILLTIIWVSSSGMWEGLLSVFDGSAHVVALHFLRLLSLASTSFIEEEHQVVYFLVMTCFLLMDHSSLIVSMILFRAARTLNQTGNKWAHLEDVSDWLRKHSELRSALFITSLISTCIIRTKEQGKWPGILLALHLIPVFLHKAAADSEGILFVEFLRNFLSERGVSEAQVVYIGSLITLITKVIVCKYLLYNTREKRRKIISEALLDSFLPLSFLLNRPENASLVLLSVLTEVILRPRLGSSKGLRNATLVYSLMGLSSFFLQGNCSSSLSKVDVSAGYTGVTSFSPVLVGTILMTSTYSGPILWLLLLYRRLVDEEKSHLTTTLLLSGTEILFYILIITLQRFHLFVWSVFSPKLLYMGVHLLVSTIMHSLLSIVIFHYA